MKQDTLHTINEIYNALKHLKLSQSNNQDVLNAIEHLKTDLKPIPKTTVETWGVLIGAAIGILGGVITFLLTALKEYHVKKKETRSKLYGELMGSRSNMIENIRQKEVSLIYSYYHIAVAEITPLKLGEEAGEIEMNLNLSGDSIKEVGIYADEYKKEMKEYEARIGQYIYLKKGKTQIKVLHDKFLQDIRSIDYEDRFKNLGSKEEIDAVKKEVFEEFDTTIYYGLICQDSQAVIDCVLNNK